MLRRKVKLSRSIFFIPALVLLAIFVVFPVVSTIYLSFLSSSGEFTFLHNYVDVLSRKEILNLKGFSQGFPLGALLHNFIWMLIHLPLTTFLGLILAVILRNVKGGPIIKSVIFLGMVTPMIIGGIILRFMFDKEVGIVNAVFSIFGVTPQSWTVYPETALFALILGSVWLWTGFSMVLYSSGLGTIPEDYYEAAKVDGATPVRMFFSITLPLLKPITVVVMTMTILWELKIFDIVYTATMGGPGGASNVLALQMYLYAFRQFDFNSASVVATFLMLLTLLVAIPMIRSISEERR
ncbi:ABC transporter permease [Candidatus Atribacteria bacterium HGW-Atribacteria-1]|nr:MAG: ABC transporter permease [Candidatus Atribacteria bacterium HGW-Atribacteria-1]